MTTYFGFDTETTGVEPGSRMLEIAAIHFDDDRNILAEFHRLADPGMPLHPDSSLIHGITAADLTGRPGVNEVLVEFLDWLAVTDPDLGVGHYASYDIGILSWELGRAGLQLPTYPVICTCAIAKSLRETKNNKLTTVLEHHGIALTGDAHRALADTRGCVDYFNLVKDRVQLKATPWSPEYAYCDEPFHGFAAAVETGTPINFDYVDANNNATSRCMIPYGWALKGGVIMFHGLDMIKQERRTFRADRVQGGLS